VKGCIKDPTATIGFCICDEDWEAIGDGTCRSPCHKSTEDELSTDPGKKDECYHGLTSVLTDAAL